LDMYDSMTENQDTIVVPLECQWHLDSSIDESGWSMLAPAVVLWGKVHGKRSRTIASKGRIPQVHTQIHTKQHLTEWTHDCKSRMMYWGEQVSLELSYENVVIISPRTGMTLNKVTPAQILGCYCSVGHTEHQLQLASYDADPSSPSSCTVDCERWQEMGSRRCQGREMCLCHDTPKYTCATNL
jgi:hypothetical protein